MSGDDDNEELRHMLAQSLLCVDWLLRESGLGVRKAALARPDLAGIVAFASHAVEESGAAGATEGKSAALAAWLARDGAEPSGEGHDAA